MTLQTRKLGQYDYYDSEKEVYVVYLDEQQTDDLKLDIKIDDNGTIWKCYLLRCKYISKSNAYKCEYKCY